MINSVQYYYVHSSECFNTFDMIFTTRLRIFSNILWIVWGHSPECLATFPVVFTVHSPECLSKFPGIFENIPRNVWRHFPECLATFPRMFGDVPRNIKSSPISCISRIPVPVFLVFYIAQISHSWCLLKLNNLFF